MQSRRAVFIGLVAGLSVTAIAHAGLRLASQVDVEDAYRYASGYLGAAYNSNTNSTEFIGCAISAGQGVTNGWCYAANAAGLTRGCYTSAPELIDLIRGLDSSGALLFSWDDDGSCVTITASQYSFMDPKIWGGEPSR